MAADWTVVPSTPEEIEAAARHCRKLVTQRALLAAGVAVVPIPGLDWVTDVGVLVKVIPRINQAFGLTPEQIERLAPDRRIVVYKAITAAGGLLIGRLITREIVLQVLRVVGVRLTVQQRSSAKSERASRGVRRYNALDRGVAQPGSATALGAVGRMFESSHPDHRRTAVGGARVPSPHTTR